MLGRLAGELGDGVATTADTVAQYGFGPDPRFQSLIAVAGQTPVGLALFFPHFSTTRALPGVYVQDLWVDANARGCGLGAHLLGAVSTHAASAWGAQYLALTVYESNPGAHRFYRRLGFVGNDLDRPMSLTGAAFRDLADT